MTKVAVPARIKLKDAPNSNQTRPAIVLANIVQILWKPVYIPMAVAVSFLSVILLIHAFEIPSVAAAYTPYRKNKVNKT